MPELPEVETIKLGLQKYLVGHKILFIEILNLKSLVGDKNKILNKKIIGIRRIGKGLIIDFDNEYCLAIHIKMTGQFIYRDPRTKNEQLSPKVGEIPSTATRLIFNLDKEGILYFNDRRKFAWLKIMTKNEAKELPLFKNMGPEPFKDLTEAKFINIIGKSKIVIKPLIMDQAKIGGIGNIYANDALFLAKINPKRPSNSLTPVESKKLYNAILKVMEAGLKHGGASELNYVNALGQEGGYQHYSLVYGKKGQKCSNCGNEIKRIVIGGRGTFFCEACQPCNESI